VENLFATSGLSTPVPPDTRLVENLAGGIGFSTVCTAVSDDSVPQSESRIRFGTQ
jgi:hypothetical protein